MGARGTGWTLGGASGSVSACAARAGCKPLRALRLPAGRGPGRVLEAVKAAFGLGGRLAAGLGGCACPARRGHEAQGGRTGTRSPLF